MEQNPIVIQIKKERQLDLSYWKVVDQLRKICRSQGDVKCITTLNRLFFEVIEMHSWKEKIKESAFSDRLLMEKYKRRYNYIMSRPIAASHENASQEDTPTQKKVAG